MADFFRLTTVLSTLVLLQGLLVFVCQSCSPPEIWRPPPTLVDNILQAQVVLYGQVRERYPDRYTKSAYTIELEVYCILKGPQTTPLIINITGAGWTPGHCESSTYLVNDEYVVRAYNFGNDDDDEPLQLTISGTHINATEEVLSEITKACGLNPATRPTGSSSNRECPVSVSDCQREPTPDERPTPSPPEENGEDIGDAPKLEIRSRDTSAAIITVATMMLAATAAAAALLLNYH